MLKTTSYKRFSNVFPIVVAKKEDGSRVQNGDHLPTLKKSIIFSLGFLPFSNFPFCKDKQEMVSFD